MKKIASIITAMTAFTALSACGDAEMKQPKRSGSVTVPIPPATPAPVETPTEPRMETLTCKVLKKDGTQRDYASIFNENIDVKALTQEGSHPADISQTAIMVVTDCRDNFLKEFRAHERRMRNPRAYEFMPARPQLNISVKFNTRKDSFNQTINDKVGGNDLLIKARDASAKLAVTP